MRLSKPTTTRFPWKGKSREYPQKPYVTINSIHWAIFLQLIVYGSTFIQIFVVGFVRRMFRVTEYVMAVQGHLIERAYATSDYSLIVTLVLPCTVFEIRRLIGRKLRIFRIPYSRLTPSLGWTLSNFWMNVRSQSLESLRYASVKISWSLRRFDSVSVWQTHRRTDNSAVGSTWLCV